MMKVNISRFAFLFFIISKLAMADEAAKPDPAKNLAEVYNFIDKNLVGKKFSYQLVRKLAGGTVEAENKNEHILGQLTRTSEGFTFQEFLVIKQKNYDLDEDGKRKDKEPQITDRAILTLFEFQVSQATGEVLGYLRNLGNSTYDGTGFSQQFRVSLADNELTITYVPGTYNDQFGPSGSSIPGITEGTIKYGWKKEKLRYLRNTTTYEVNPATMEKAEKALYVINDEYPLE